MKMYVVNYDGTNYGACLAKTKKEAVELFNTTSYQFSQYGSIYPVDKIPPVYGKLPEEGKVFYKPFNNYSDKYPWRETRYLLYWDENKRSQYK